MIVFVFMLVLANVFVNKLMHVIMLKLVLLNVSLNVSKLVFATMVGINVAEMYSCSCSC